MDKPCSKRRDDSKRLTAQTPPPRKTDTIRLIAMRQQKRGNDPVGLTLKGLIFIVQSLT